MDQEVVAEPTEQPDKKSPLFKNLKFSKLQLGILTALVAAVGIWLIFRSHASGPATVSQTNFAPGHILVSFKPGADTATQHKLLGRYGLAVKKDIPQIGTKVVTVNPKARDAVIKALSHNPAVKFAEKDFTATAAATPNDPCFAATNSFANGCGAPTGQWPHIVMKNKSAWDITTGSSSVIVAVVDSGIDASHPDLAGKTVAGYNVLNGSSTAIDISGHGEYVAGTIAANSNNSQGVAGVCWACRLMPVKITDTGSATYSDIAAGITWATDHGAQVINVSYGGTSASSAVNSAVTYAISRNVVVVAAAGNSGVNTVNYPGGSPGAIAVAASDQSDNLMNYSNFGSWVQVAAPTSQVTTWLKDPSTQLPYGYGPVGGTSISSPMVAGTIALMRSAKPTATVDQIKQALFSTTDPLSGKTQAGTSESIQYGRANTLKAIQSLTGVTLPPADTTAPTASISSPASGATVSGQISINASASDNVGVTKVELYRNGALYATSTAAPYSFFWDTNASANGSYSLSTKAYDAAGNVGTSSTVTVTVSNTAADTTAPTTTVTAPANGSTVSDNNVTVSASSSDSVGVTSTELYIDGLLRGSSNSGSVAFAWNTTQESNGNHTILSKAYDAAGNVGTSSTVSVTVSNSSDTVAPTVTITSPGNNSIITGNINVSAQAADNVGVTKMELLIDGKLKATSTASTLNYAWNIKGLKSGSHTLQVNTYDAAGNIGTTSVSVIK